MAQTRGLRTFEIGVPKKIRAFDLVGCCQAALERLVPAPPGRCALSRMAPIEDLTLPRVALSSWPTMSPWRRLQKHEVFKGPAVRKIAFDAAGAPTKAAEGFARGKGLL